ncbi:MAG: hypothetical protein H6767_06070 [Candidatus Peribacteria bacterium]|nr:MAG: hypothetical protein H6767_06070 [Candidatus Peribacteria bacterium]
MIQPAANYSFNKSHAACYAFIAYQTAYLKAYYRTEFLTSLMVSDEENMERVVLEVGECESKAVEVLPPSVNESMKHFTYISDTQIRFGLKAIKGVGDGPINKILDMRPPLNPLLTKEGKDSEQESRGGFESLEQFIELCGKEVVNKKSLEALILSGAMDDLGERGQMFASIDAMIQFSRRDERKKETNQIGLFDATDNFEDALELKDVPAMVFEEKLIGEKEMLGLYVSGHPLDGLARYCQRRSSNIKKLKMSMEELLEIDKKEHPEKYEKDSIEDTQTGSDGNESKKASQRVEEKQEIVQAVGLITDLRKIITKGGKPMVFLKCDGFDYEFEVVIFPKDVEKYEQKLQEGKIVIVNGQLSVNFEYGRKGLQARDIKIATITQVRQQAEEMSLLSSKRRLRDVALNVLIEDTTKDDPEGPLEESMSE